MLIHRGFTLIELMVTILIMVILAGVAVPMYSNYITKAKARNAGADLVALSLLIESLYQRNLTYKTSKTTSTTDTEAYAEGWYPTEGQTFKYTIDVDATSKQYTLTATGISNTRNDGCILTLTNANVRDVNTSSGCGGLTSW